MKTIFVNGTFDILHHGHIELLNYAKSLGDKLVVAIDSNQRVKELKGLDRPVNDESIRKFLLENLKAVDEVEIFGSNADLLRIIMKHTPSIMVKGSDWRGKTIVGGVLVPEIVYYERTNDESTTRTIEDYINRRQLR